MPTIAKITQRYAYLSTEFGANYACKIFGLTESELEEKTGRYVRGKRKGQLKGKLVWLHCTSGGWLSKPYGGGMVVKPGTRAGHKIVDSWTDEIIHSDIAEDSSWSTWDIFSATLTMRESRNRQAAIDPQAEAQKEAERVKAIKERVIGLAAFAIMKWHEHGTPERKAAFEVLVSVREKMGLPS